MLPLEGTKILDLSRVGVGSLCAMVLGDFGAEVIKIEPPPTAGAGSGGTGRDLAPQGEEGRRDAAFYPLNRNKKNLSLNLRSEGGKQVFYRLCRTADVVIEGFRPGVVQRLKVGYDTLKELNPGIIYCSISGYGQDGPYRDLPGHDINYISVAGVLGILGKAGGPPSIPFNLVGDFAGGSLHALIGILLALAARNRTGRGQKVDVAITDGALALMAILASDYFKDGIFLKQGEGSLNGAFPYYNVYQTKDGKFISLGCIEPWFWENLCRQIGREDFIPYGFSSGHFLSRPQDEKTEEIYSFLRQLFLTRTRDEWFELFKDKNIPISKVYSLDEVFSDPQVLHRKMVVEIEDPGLGRVRQVGIPIKLSDTPGTVRRLAPILGQHTDEVLVDLGYSKEDISRLRQEGTVA